MLDSLKTRGFALLGFAILFAIAASARLVSFLLLKRQHHPPFTAAKRDAISLVTFLRNKDTFRTFSFYLMAFNAAIMLASPFYALYMLRELQFSYVTFTIVSVSSTIIYLLCIPFAGSFSDRYGNRRLMVLASACFVLTPLPWIFTADPFWLIGTSQLISGIGNAALIIAATNFTLDAVPQKRRAQYTAYSNILSGIGIFIGPLIGGAIIESLHPASLNPYVFLFIVAIAARLLVMLFFLPCIKEVKKVSPLPPLSLELAHPWKALHTDIVWVKHVLR